ncbi:MAG TPA: AlkA N-terminal domain-containing protein [Tepidisphaeraceae bacterium]|jgi:AraC family transcriptional regulator of adaptative response / DNA-3-methyladenine glycosylase II|nr:AlkA N-terminal domain-containing protein [Tepidisphaeraceae bacterium]
MPTKDDAYYQAMLARDYRFDGKFFVGVKTTGVYCRPICPARPKRQNVEFFPHASAAERAGYRPCLRCRPEAAPQSPAGTSTIVQRALRLIAANQLHPSSEDAFAHQFGLSPRHLRRLFNTEIGQTPKQIADNTRLNFARTLVVETALPMTDISLTAGFSSLRRFNAAFKSRFHRPPSDLRRPLKAPHENPGFTLTLSYRPPFDWPALLSFYQSHTIPGLESTTPNSYQRLFHLNSSPGLLRVTPADTHLNLHILTKDPTVLFEVTRRVRRMFDLDSDPVLIANAFAAVPLLDRSIRRHPGLRLARGWDPFETAICTFLGQLVSIPHASALAGQLIHHYGDQIPHPLTGLPTRLFPTPKTLATSDLAHLKTTTARKQTLREFSRRLLAGELSLSEAQDPASFRQSLLTIKGVGPWSAEYISLRALADPDAFPATDLILARALALHPNLNLDQVQPWRAYAAVHLWNQFKKQKRKTATDEKPMHTDKKIKK